MNHSTAMTLAAAAAVVLRQAIHAIEARTDWTPAQKRVIPWVCVGLGVLVAIVSTLAGLPVDDAVTLGGGPLGAVIVNELAPKKTPPSIEPLLVLVCVGLAACGYPDSVDLLAAAGCSAIVALPVLLVSLALRRLLRRALPIGALLLVALPLAACTPAYVTAGTIADGLRGALGGYHLWSHVERRRILDEAAVKCGPLPTSQQFACADAALLPFDLKQKPVLACVPAVAPLVRAAEKAAAAKDATAAAALIPQLVAGAAECGRAIEEARR